MDEITITLMSAIFGIFNINGSTVEVEHLQQMQSAMSYWGPDGKYLWFEGPAGLGQMQLYNVPESINEKFPLIDNERGLIFVSAARIDNRSELYNLLSIPNEKKLIITDAELIFTAYRKWEKDCVHKLLGDWCFAVWDKNKQQLFLARDQHGISGLYYYHDEKFFVFSSSLKGILCLPFVPKKINELKLAQTLVSWPGNGSQTCYANILRLPPSNYLIVTSEKIEKTRYWFLENTKELKLKSNDDYIESFKNIFTEAIKCRLRSYRKIGSTLSSGLDSSSVSVVAANLLKDQGKRLPVFTSIPMFDCQQLIKSNLIANEGPLAALTVGFNSNMYHYLLKSENILVLDGIKKALWIHDQPVHAAGNAYWINDLMSKAQSIDCGTILIGQCGNSTISWPVNNYFNWYISHLNSDIDFKNTILKVMPDPLINLIKKIKYGTNPWIRYSAINPQFARTIRLSEEMKNAGFDPTFSAITDSIKSRLQLIKPGNTIVGHLWLETGAAYNIEVRDPTIDLRILEFCLSIPDNVYITDGKDRMLIRRAMQGLLPDEVLWNNRWGLQAADLTYRLETELHEWQLLADSFLNNSIICEFLDCSKIKGYLDILHKQKLFKEYVSIVTRGCMAGYWLMESGFDKK